MSVDPLAEKYTYNSTYAFQENKMGLGVELEGLELDPFDPSLSNAEAEQALYGQMTTEALATTSLLGSFVDFFFGKASVTLSNDLDNPNGDNFNTTIESTISAEGSTNLESFFSDYNVDKDGNIHFTSDPINFNIDTKTTVNQTLKASTKVSPVANATFTAKASKDVSTNQTTKSANVTVGTKGTGLFVTGSINNTTGSTKVKGGVTTSVETPKVNGFKFKAKVELGVQTKNDKNK